MIGIGMARTIRRMCILDRPEQVQSPVRHGRCHTNSGGHHDEVENAGETSQLDKHSAHRRTEAGEVSKILSLVLQESRPRKEDPGDQETRRLGEVDARHGPKPKPSEKRGETFRFFCFSHRNSLGRTSSGGVAGTDSPSPDLRLTLVSINHPTDIVMSDSCHPVGSNAYVGPHADIRTGSGFLDGPRLHLARMAIIP